MARYVDDFMGIPNEYHRVRGMDPNYREHYRGMRMRGHDYQAPYGWYRARHRDALGHSAGFHGIVSWDYTGGGYDRGYRGYDRGFGIGDGGAVYNPYYDRHYLWDYNAYGEAIRSGGGRGDGYDREMRPLLESVHEGYRQSYGNRGVSSGGYG